MHFNIVTYFRNHQGTDDEWGRRRRYGNAPSDDAFFASRCSHFEGSYLKGVSLKMYKPHFYKHLKFLTLQLAEKKKNFH